ncbi:MAG: histidine--tRNA ligase [Candidatus Cloacimonadota bacterium]|nr:MAG: histidine--tRNA ligase [Candidatus Cloacimonadota bacterium]
MSLQVTPTKGMKDFMPSEAIIREKARKIIFDTYMSFGFSPVETPSVEHLHLLNNGEGGDNEKLIFKILKRGDKLKNITNIDSLSDSALRYDLTVPLSRFYSNNQGNLPKPFKAIQMGHVFRAERPQKGRFRQFVQCDIDILGEDSIYAETDLLMASSTALKNLGLKETEIKINDRRILFAIAKYCGFKETEYNSFFITLDKLDKIGSSGIIDELLKNGYDQKRVDKVKKIIEQFENRSVTIDELDDFIENSIPENVKKDLKQIIDVVLGNNQPIKFDPVLVRGMSYYTGTIFEFKYRDYPGSVGGGGRYDKMIEKMVGKSVPACGFSIGFERIMILLKEENIEFDDRKEEVALLFSEDDDLTSVYKKTKELINKNYNVSNLKQGKKLGKQLKNLKLQGFSLYCIFSEGEIKELK